MRKLLTFVFLATLSSYVFAHPPKTMTDHAGMYAEFTTAAMQEVCSARQPATTAQWKKNVENWKSSNVELLNKLSMIAGKFENSVLDKFVNSTSKSDLQKALSDFLLAQNSKNLGGLQVFNQFARLNDVEASSMCAIWLDQVSRKDWQKIEMERSLKYGEHLLSDLK